MNRKLYFFLASSVPAVLGLLLWTAPGRLGWLGALLRAYALAFVLGLALWLLTRALRFFLWRVSRRLAFSYFLIGIVPIPLVAILVLLAAYLVSGLFLGHLYRNGLSSLATDVRYAARAHIEHLSHGHMPRSEAPVPVEIAYYKNGRKFAGSAAAPTSWQSWWPNDDRAADLPPTQMLAQLVAGADGKPTIIGAASDSRLGYGVVAIYSGDLERELSERAGIWVELFPPGDPRDAGTLKLTIGHKEYPLKPVRLGPASPEQADFFHPGIEDPGWADRPFLAWVEEWRPYLNLGDGDRVADHLSASLIASPRAVSYFMVPRAAEIDAYVYLIFVGVAFLLFDIYAIALLMALLMIFGLSSAVNHLTDATKQVQKGDFSTRIEVRRTDQLGALQSYFNRMTSNLEGLVAAAAQKEVLEKELAIAQELQQSLLPDTMLLPGASDSLRFATHFEPSTAIGGDYYDFLESGDRLAVVIADVSGHGLSAGLRMAMVKAALQLLCEENHGDHLDGVGDGMGPEHRPQAILHRLHRLLRAGDRRGFVTATLSLIDRQTGELLITNAGHPPTYLLHGGEVREIVLPSSPLGALGSDFSQTAVTLAPGDTVVWLSDGLIEATDASGKDFGYDETVAALRGAAGDPVTVRDRLLMAIDAHTGGGSPEDDRTLVVMTYRPDENPDEAAPRDA